MKSKWTESPGSKMVGLIAIFILLALSLIVINDIGSRLVSGSRAYIAGEGEWTKAQKQASLALIKYIEFNENEYFAEFEDHLEVIEGDRQARILLNSGEADHEEIYREFLRGNNQPDDIPDLIWLYRNFSDIEPIMNAISYWEQGDELVNELRELGFQIRDQVESSGLDEGKKAELLNTIFTLDNRLSEVETEFSMAMNQSAEWVSDWVYWLTVLITLFLTIGVAVITIIQFKTMNAWNSRLRYTEKKFRNVLDNSRDVIYQMDAKTGRYEYMSPSVKSLLGYSPEEIMNGGVDFMLNLTHPDDLARMKQEVSHLGNMQPSALKDTEFRVRDKEGNYFWVNNKRSVLREDGGETVRIIGNVRDISERKKYVDALDRSLKEKEMLLAEIHHRVKNNLSIVSSLLELQKESKGNSSREEDYQEIQSRIKSIALVHEKLYQTETFADIDLSDYIRDLSNMIINMFDSEESKVEMDQKLDSIVVNIKQAVPIGLICNELINNCYKYAFKDMNEGVISIILKREDDDVLLKVSDNGTGLPDDFDLNGKSSLGMTLLNALTSQIRGELNVTSEPGKGTNFTIRFPHSYNS